MSTAAEPGDTRPPRPSPFAFPSDTTFRFALLVAAVLGATLYVWNWLWIVVGADKEAVVVASRACLELAGLGPAQAESFNACVQDTYRDSTWWMLAGVLLVLAVAAALAFAWPWLKERRAGFRPLDPEDAPDVLAALGELSREAGLREEPRWTWNPLQTAATGVAYGRPGSYAVGLTGGLVVTHVTDPGAFRAIVRHELAHVRNRDVLVTYATLAFWYAFLLAAVVPFLVTILDEGVALSVTWRLLALAALVYLTRNSVLRAREVYADLRASVADGPQGALGRVVAALPARPERLSRRLLALHPSPGERAAALRDTRPLFELAPVAAFAAGLAATINFDSVHSLVAWWVDDPLDIGLTAALVFAPLVVGVVGVALWRDRFGALAGRTETQAVWPLALALTAGFLIGPELSLLQGVAAPDERGLLGSVLRGDDLVWLAALLAIVALLLSWIGNGAWVWLRAEAARRPRDASTAGLLVAAAVLTIVLGTYYALRDLAPAITFSKALTAQQHAQVDAVAWAGPTWLWQLIMDPQTQLVLERPFVPLAVVALWAFPLAVVLVRRRRTGEAPWAFLDPGGRIDPERPRVSVRRPLAVGAAAGVTCLLAYVAYRAGIHASVDPGTRARDEFLLGFFFWQLVLALAAQAIAGGVATALARDSVRLAEGLCAATVAGSIAVFGLVAGPFAGGCADPISVNPGPCSWTVSADFTWDVWRQAVAQGAVVAVGAGLVVLAAHALLRARKPADELSTAGASGL